MLTHEIKTTDSGSIVPMSGSLEFSDHENFRQILDAIDQADGSHFVLELSGLESIDSSGLGMFIIARKAAERRNIRLVLRSARGDVRHMIETARFSSVFLVEP